MTGNESPQVVVIGAAAIDTKGTAQAQFQPGQSNPGNIRISEGGVGRNIAENLSRLGIHTILISAIGDDSTGRRILRQAAESGIDTSHVIRARENSSGAYIALFDYRGAPMASMYDMSIMKRITSRYIYDRRALIREASFVVVDANLPKLTLAAVLKLARQYGVPVCADPTSNSLAARLKPHLQGLYMVTPDIGEAEVLTDTRIHSRLEAIEAAKKLVAQGVTVAIVTMAEQGVCYATSDVTGHVPALDREIVDLTGVGDAMTAAVVFGLLNHFCIDEAVRLGASAASLTLQCRETVCPTLTLEHLYDNLLA